MNKIDLINEVAKNAALTKKDAKSAIEAALDIIRKNTKKGVRLIGFGSFKVVKRKGRKGRNPRTGEAITIRAKNVVKFTPGKAFKG